MLFQQAELPANGLGRQIEALAGAGDAALLCHRPEIVKVFIVNHRPDNTSVNTNIIAIIIDFYLALNRPSLVRNIQQTETLEITMQLIYPPGENGDVEQPLNSIAPGAAVTSGTVF